MTEKQNKERESMPDEVGTPLEGEKRAEAEEQRCIQAERQAEANKIAAAKRKKTLTWLLPSLAAVIAAVLVIVLVIAPASRCKDASILLAANSIHTVGLRADGSVVAVGYNEDGRCDVSDWNLF